MENKTFYIGNGKKLNDDGLKIQINLTQLREALKDAEVQKTLKSYIDKNGVKNELINIAVWPLKPENVTDYRTHSVKVDMWKPTEQPQSKPKKSTKGITQPLDEPEIDELPF